jgi:phosphate:Na+ symporter
MFNVLGVLIWVGLIPVLADLVVRISPAAPELEGLARRAAEAPRQIANAHTLFNVFNTILFIGFTGQFARLVTRLVPDRAEPERERVKPRFLDPELVRTPALALERVRLEIGHLGELVEGSLALMRGESPRRHAEVAEGVAELEGRIDRLHEHILRYLGEVRRQRLTDRESEDFVVLMSTSDQLENIGDIVEDNLVEAGNKALQRGIRPSDMTWRMFAGLHDEVAQALNSALKCVVSSDVEAARDAFARKASIKARIDDVLAHQAERLALDDPKRPAVFRLEMEVASSYRRIYTLCLRIVERATGRGSAKT